jgi:hypothetical protein
VRELLTGLSKETYNWYLKNENNTFRSSLPTIFSSKIEIKEEIPFKENTYIFKILHLRDELFLLANSK